MAIRNRTVVGHHAACSRQLAWRASKKTIRSFSGSMAQGNHDAMAKYIIIAHEMNSAKTRYFEGYDDYGIVGEARWGFDLKSAQHISALEVETERLLLTMLCPNLVIDTIRLNEYWYPKPA